MIFVIVCLFGGYMHLDKLPNNKKNSSFIELQPGLAVCVNSADDLNAIDISKAFPSSDKCLCFNCQLQGKLSMQVKNRKLVTHKGDLTFGFADGETFHLQHSKDFCNIEVMIMPELLDVLLGEMDFQFSNLDKKVNFFLHHHPIHQNSNVLSCARELFYLMQNTDQSNRLLVYAHVLKYLNWYFKSFDNHLGRQEFTQWEYKQFNDARDYLISDLTNPPTIDWLAKQVGLNHSKLKKGFKQIFGKSIYAYYLTERMNKAKQLLIENSVTETAIMLGYSNISHFSSAFRKQFGVLPKEMRRQYSYNNVK